MRPHPNGSHRRQHFAFIVGQGTGGVAGLGGGGHIGRGSISGNIGPDWKKGGRDENLKDEVVGIF